jgi:transcriptional regulator GlxA family with amidase domain
MPRKPAGRTRSLGRRRLPAAERAQRGVLDVTVVLIPEGYASEAIAPAEIFHSAGALWQSLRGDAPQPRFRVRVASIDGAPVTSLCGLRLVPELAIQDVEHTDIIVLSASGLNVQEQIARGTSLLPWLREWHARGAYIAAVCTGAAFLAESGLLDGRQATTHWALADTLRRQYPKVLWRPEQFVTEDNHLFCSGGVYSSIDLSLYLVEKFCGREVALQCAKAMLLSMPRHSQTGYAVLPLSPPHSDAKIREAETYLQKRFDRAVSLDQLARAVGMSPRNLIRRFKAATGRVPGDYVQTLRVAAARELLERGGGVSVQEVCSQVGYEDLAFFRHLFKRHTGLSPAEYRSRFAGMSVERGNREPS